MAKVGRRKAHGRRIHRTSAESAGDRMKKRLLGKDTWYRKRMVTKEPTKEHNTRGNEDLKTRGARGDPKLRTRAVIFVEQTHGGELASQLRELLLKLEPILTFRLRVVERTGRNILSNFPQTATWSVMACGRGECIICTQGGEELPACSRHSVVYKSICVVRNPIQLQRRGGYRI